MALDLGKYRALFLEEAGEHLGEISRALLELEKDAEVVEAIDTIFRMAHSIKSMAASLGYDSISEVAHALEDRMEGVRSAGRVDGAGGLDALFKGLEGLENMVAVVRDTGEPPPPRPDLLEVIASVPVPDAEALATDDAPASGSPEAPPGDGAPIPKKV